jgi:hypothetical protein
MLTAAALMQVVDPRQRESSQRDEARLQQERLASSGKWSSAIRHASPRNRKSWGLAPLNTSSWNSNRGSTRLPRSGIDSSKTTREAIYGHQRRARSLEGVSRSGTVRVRNARSAETHVCAPCITSYRVWDIAAGYVCTWNTPFAKNSRDSGVSPAESHRNPSYS